MEKLYAERDHMSQDKAGNYYSRHVSAMTAESLHSKSDIAGELAHRDILIDTAQRRIERLEGALRQAVADLSAYGHPVAAARARAALQEAE